MHGTHFLLQVNIKYWKQESFIDWKGRGGAALWHLVPTSDDGKLMKEWVPEAGFSQDNQRCHRRTSLRGNCGCKHDLDTAIYEDSKVFPSVSLKGSD